MTIGAVPSVLEPLRQVVGAVEASALVDQALSNPLPIRLAKQALSEWCWAAVTSAIEVLYQEAYAAPQCQVATRCFGSPCCPPGPDTPDNPRNNPYNVYSALGPNGAAGQDGQIPPADMMGQINQGRPVCCIVDWADGTQHVVILAGYTPNGDVWIDDPAAPGFQRIPWGAFIARYGDGAWRHTVTTKRSTD